MKRIPVTVHTSDPLSETGILSFLRDDPTLEVLDREEPRTGGVAVVHTGRLHELAATKLRRLSRGSDQAIVLIADRLREPEMMAVVECGVRVVLWRQQATPGQLVEAIHSAARGESLLPPDLLSRLLAQTSLLYRHTLSDGDQRPTLGLSLREVDVIKLVAEGLGTREIADKLAYSERTVKNVLHAMMTRMQLRNRAHAVAYALREGHI
ncbi:response regulator transcription factor [Streptomyces sp. NPDC041068]|uniref:helix-turn-helix transcriptional regulator n=1 Tax=Streptomyces sp. NPDC041068 TaxID=3155130 RepID=UPI0033D3E704